MNLDDVDLGSELRWATIEPELDEFQNLLAPSVPRLQIEREADVLEWQKQNGVYLLFDEHERLLYVGLTLNGFGTRVAKHKQDKLWRWTDIILFPKTFEFFAPALETFLRQRLTPILDAGGKHI